MAISDCGRDARREEAVGWINTRFPQAPEKAVLLVATYAVAFFSIMAQGLTLGPLVRAYGMDLRASACEGI